MGIGSITFSLPHFLAGNYMIHSDLNATSDNICKVPAPIHRVPGGDDDLLEQLPGLDKIKSLTKGKQSQKLLFQLDSQSSQWQLCVRSFGRWR